MKHKDISWLLAPPPPKEVTNHESTIAKEMDVYECEAHTPRPGPIGYKEETLGVMTVMYTPLLGPIAVHTSQTGPTVCTGAGILTNKRGRTDKSVQSSINIPDMRKVGTDHGSLKLSIKIDKSSAVVGGRHEQLWDILDMIAYWEDMEEGEEGNKEDIQPEEGNKEDIQPEEG